MSCNSTLFDIAHVLVTNSLRAFPSEGRTTVTSPLQFSSRVLYIDVLLVPPGAYNTLI
jgi:hypothetical protein